MQNPINTIVRLFFVSAVLLAPLPVAASPIVQELIKITDDRLVYRDKFVTIPITRKNLVRVFGAPSREVYNTAGTIVIWDDLGLSCFGCEKKDKKPEEFQYMTKEERSNLKVNENVESIRIFVRKYQPYPKRENRYIHEPRLPFQGRILLDGVELDGVVTFDTFVATRNSNQTILLPENAFSFFVRCKPAPHEITLHSIRDKYDEDFMSIYSVTIRNVGQYYRKIPCVDVFDINQTPEPVEDIKQYRIEQESPNNFDGTPPLPE